MNHDEGCFCGISIVMKNFYQTILSNSNLGKRTKHLTNVSNISRACNKKFGGCIITKIIKQILRERERERENGVVNITRP